MLSLHLDRSLYARTAHLTAVAHCGDLPGAYQAYRELMRACTPNARTPNQNHQKTHHQHNHQNHPQQNHHSNLENNEDNAMVDPPFVATRQHVPLPAVASLLHTCLVQQHGWLGLTVFTEYCHRAGDPP